MTEYHYPIRFSYKRLCDRCKVLVDCDATVFEPGKILYVGHCGHMWDINGDPLEIPKWLNSDKKFRLQLIPFFPDFPQQPQESPVGHHLPSFEMLDQVSDHPRPGKERPCRDAIALEDAAVYPGVTRRDDVHVTVIPRVAVAHDSPRDRRRVTP